MFVVGHGQAAQSSKDGKVPPASARAPGDGHDPIGLHAPHVPRLQGQGGYEEGDW